MFRPDESGRNSRLVHVERFLCGILLVIGVALHLRFWVCAGPLWRDEADTILKATAPTFAEVLETAKIGPFPLPPLLLFRAWSMGGNSDLWYRSLCFFIGLFTLACLWWTAWRIHRRLPLLAAALFTLSPVVLIEGDSVRAYGLGALFPLLTFLFLWETLSKPSKARAALAALFGILSVQCTYPNVVTIAALGLAAAAVAVRHRWWNRLGILAAIGAGIGLSLLPYLGIVGHFAHWKTTLAPLFGYREIGTVLAHTFDLGLPYTYLLWAVLAVFAIGVLIARLRHFSQPGDMTDRLDLSLYAAGTLILGLVFQILFVKRSVISPFERYFLTNLALSAVAVESILEADGLWRIARDVVVAAVILACTVPVVQKISARRTNIDVIASGLEEQASSRDLIVLSKWYLAFSFQRYYHGKAPWVTAPWMPIRPLSNDNLPAMVAAPDPMGPTLAAAAKAWATGGRIWVIGYIPPYILNKTPPLPKDGNLFHFYFVWDQQLFGFLQNGGTGSLIPVMTVESVNPLEYLALMVWTPNKS